MITKIVNGISSTIYAKFGPGYKIYTERVEQGLAEPCFFIKVLGVGLRRIHLERYQLDASLDVHYFPAESKFQDMNDVALALHSILKRVLLLDGEMLNGWDIRWEFQSGVLHFFVSYRPIVYYPEVPDELMASLRLNERVEE